MYKPKTLFSPMAFVAKAAVVALSTPPEIPRTIPFALVLFT